jgi:hypothetical protein
LSPAAWCRRAVLTSSVVSLVCQTLRTANKACLRALSARPRRGDFCSRSAGNALQRAADVAAVARVSRVAESHRQTAEGGRRSRRAAVAMTGTAGFDGSLPRERAGCAPRRVREWLTAGLCDEASGVWLMTAPICPLATARIGDVSLSGLTFGCVTRFLGSWCAGMDGLVRLSVG